MNDKGLMGIEPPGFNGVVRFGQRPLEVRNGVFKIGPKQFYVSDDGKVTDENDNQIAEVRNGQLAPTAPDQKKAA